MCIKLTELIGVYSYYSSVLLTIFVTPLARIEFPKLFSPKADRKQFHYLLNDNINLKIKLKSNEKKIISETVKNLTTIIRSVAWTKSVKINNFDRIYISNSNYPLVPEEIRNLKVEKRSA